MEKNEKKKETSTLRGMVRRYSDQSFEFTPFGRGEPVYEEQHKYKNGVTVGKTRGSNARQVVRIAVDADAPDLYDACLQKLGEALPDAAAQSAATTGRGVVLLSGPGLRLLLNKTKGTISYQGEIDMTKTPNYTNQFVKQFNELNQCLAINKTSLLNVIHALQKHSTN